MKKFKMVNYDLESDDSYLLPKKYKHYATSRETLERNSYRKKCITGFIGKSLSGGAFLMLILCAVSMFMAFSILVNY